MEAPIDPKEAGSRHGRGQPLARSLRAAYDRVARLAAWAHLLCSRRDVAGISAELGTCLSLLAHELNEATRALAHRAAELGFRGWSRRGAAAARRAVSAKTLSALIARFRSGCLACGQKLCGLLELARRADAACAQIVYELLRTLERQVWVLRPYTKGRSKSPA